MITAKQFGLLRKGNAAVNAEKCKVRIPSAFKSASTKQRKQIFELSGLKSPNSFYSIEKTGSASPKVVLSLAQVLGISPYFLTGESDSEKPCNDEVLSEFFKKGVGGKEKSPRAKKTVAKKVSDKPVAKKPTPAAKKQATSPSKVIKPIAAKAVADKKKVAPPIKPQIEKTNAPAKPTVKAEKSVKIDDGSLVKLLEALAIRAKFGGEAEVTYNKVVELLVK